MPVADSDMVVDSDRLYEGKTPSSSGSENIIPVSLGSPAANTVRNFYHTKRVGNYLIGRKLGEGSFAKVREGLHALTGEKVGRDGMPTETFSLNHCKIRFVYTRAITLMAGP